MRTTRATSGSALRRSAPNQAAARPRPAAEDFFALAADFAALRNRPEDWALEFEERRIWECTLADGLIAEELHGPRRVTSGTRRRNRGP